MLLDILEMLATVFGSRPFHGLTAMSKQARVRMAETLGKRDHHDRCRIDNEVGEKCSDRFHPSRSLVERPQLQAPGSTLCEPMPSL